MSITIRQKLWGWVQDYWYVIYWTVQGLISKSTCRHQWPEDVCPAGVRHPGLGGGQIRPEPLGCRPKLARRQVAISEAEAGRELVKTSPQRDGLGPKPVDVGAIVIAEQLGCV